MTKALTLQNPLWLIAAVAAVVGALAAFGGGLAGFLAQGGLAQVFTFAIALACGLLAVRLVMYLRLTVVSDWLSHEIDQNPVAAALLRGAWVIFAGLCVLAIFG